MTVIERHQKHEEPHSAMPYVFVWVALLVLTGVTFGLAHVNLGKWNLLIAMFIATVKSSLVVLIFMHLKQHAGANRLVFSTALFFVALLVGLSVIDVFTRPTMSRPFDTAYEVRDREGTLPEAPPVMPAAPVVH